MKPFKARRTSAPALEWICDLSGQAARVTTIGNRALLVENHCGIRAYSREKIILATRCGCIEVRGALLELNDVRRNALVIRGSIQDVRLPCEEGASHES